MLKEFKAFILRGNVVDLAVGIIIGAAFKDVVDSLVKNIFTPLIGAIGGADFTSLHIKLRDDAVIGYGAFITSMISFVLIAAAVFFFVVKPINSLTSRRKRAEPDPAKTTKDCPYCLTAIPLAATRCSACTSAVEPVPAT